MQTSDRQAVGTRAYGYAVILMVGILTVGCASMINPHLKVGDRPETVQILTETNQTIRKDISIDEAIAYANRVKDEYRKALGNEAMFRNLLGVGLIGVATAVPIMALTDTSTKTIGITALAGASAYGLGVWLQSTPRQKAYVQGYNAVNCAIEAMSPLRNARTGSIYTTFKTAFDTVDDQIENVEEAAGAVKKIRNDSPTQADEAIGIANTAIKEAKEARTSAIELEQELNSAGDNLVTAVDAIIGKVDLIIIDNQLDMAALSSIIGGLGGIYNQFSARTPGLIGGGEIGAGVLPSKGLDLEGANINDLLANLQNEVVKLATLTRQITDFVNTVINKQPVEALKKCNVDPSVIATALSIEPPTGVFTGGIEETQAFVIQGGVRPYRVALLTGQGANVIVSQPDLFGPAFVVQIKADTPKSTYSIYAADATGRNVILKVVVGKPTTTSSVKQNGSVTITRTPGGKIFEEKNLQDRQKAQKALCVVPDGRWGPKTRAALMQHEAKDTMTQELFDKLLKMSEKDINLRCPDLQASSLNSVSGFLNERAVNVGKGGENYVAIIKKVRVDSNANGRKLLVELGISSKPNQLVTIMDLSTAVFEEAKKMPSFPTGVTVEMFEIENATELKDTGKLDP